ncbi:MAG: hypothetical protein KF774_02665 [Planctomyces sp.]|nr:hypothetical protein [Planctomyces sp.]
MSHETSGIVSRRFRAPQQDGELLAVPPLGDLCELAASNRARIDESTSLIDGRPLSELRRLSRTSIRTGCANHEGCAEALWYVTGHQPLLAHPGVWVKNIAVSRLAARCGGVGVNLIVDNDILLTRGIAIPRGPRNQPTLAMETFDAPGGQLPGEEARILDEALFESFGDRVRARIEADWGYAPALGSLWPAAVDVQRQGGGLVAALTAVRIELERRAGIGNVELPISLMSETDAFLHLVRHLARRAEAFRECHNRWLAAYRRSNRIRSRSHPVPELVRQGEWTEIPAWTWKGGDSHRRQVLSRIVGDTIELSNGQSVFVRFSAQPGEAGLEPLRELASRNIRMRPRALLTTLFSRLLLADVFLHGIGGAKYDELTDAIAAEFFALEMPSYATLTATRRLPIGPGYPGAWAERHLSQVELRSLEFNAERHLPGGSADPRAVEKLRLISELRPLQGQTLRGALRARRRDVARRLAAVEQSLAADAADLKIDRRRQRHAAEQKLAAHKVLMSREYAAVLHPENAYAAWVAQVSGELESKSAVGR